MFEYACAQHSPESHLDYAARATVTLDQWERVIPRLSPRDLSAWNEIVDTFLAAAQRVQCPTELREHVRAAFQAMPADELLALQAAVEHAASLLGPFTGVIV